MVITDLEKGFQIIMAKTLWKQGNKSQYLEIPTGSNIDASIDYINRLQTGEKLQSVTHTVTQGNVTINNSFTNSNQALHGTQLHRAVCFLTPNTTGVHRIKVETQTDQGRTFVHSFEVHSKT